MVEDNSGAKVASLEVDCRIRAPNIRAGVHGFGAGMLSKSEFAKARALLSGGDMPLAEVKKLKA